MFHIKRDILILANPASGNGKGLRLAQHLKKKLDEKKISHRLILLEKNLQKIQLKKNELEDYASLWLIGGDGTLHLTLNHFGIPSIPVALISAGTGNDFARCLLNTTNTDMQIAIALQAYSAPVDIGTCNGLYFATGLGIGFDGLVAKKVSLYSRFARGPFAYYMAVIANLAFYQSNRMIIKYNDEIIDRNCFMTTVGNIPAFGGGFRITPKADPRDGIFDLNIIYEIGKLSRFLHLNKAKTGQHQKLSFVHSDRINSILIETVQKLPCHLDGELYEWNSFDVKVLPKALNLIQRRSQ